MHAEYRIEHLLSYTLFAAISNV